MTDALCAVVRAVAEDYQDFTIRNINRELATRLQQPPAVSQTTISCILDGRLITTKTLEDAPAEGNSDRKKQQRQAFATWLMHGVQETLLVVFTFDRKKNRKKLDEGVKGIGSLLNVFIECLRTLGYAITVRFHVRLQVVTH